MVVDWLLSSAASTHRRVHLFDHCADMVLLRPRIACGTRSASLSTIIAITNTNSENALDYINP